jgi:UDP-N-acetylmuramoyl-tripeptide--D-alanyl-D-alanine ligase
VRYCETVLIDKSMIASKYREGLPEKVTYYGSDDYRITHASRKGLFQVITLQLHDMKLKHVQTQFIGSQNLHAVLAAAAVAHRLALDASQIEAGIRALAPVPGRLQLLHGVEDSVILDDSYNASPEAVIAALGTLAEVGTGQRIALLGSMNELGASSGGSHRAVGLHCDPEQLDLVITLGDEANEHIAPAARAAGCKVLSTDSPYTAGQLIRDHLKKGATILIKGSQNRVFAEEAIKLLLADPADEAKLVRQSPYWMRVKRSQFGDIPR